MAASDFEHAGARPPSGSERSALCAACGAALRAGQRYCHRCGVDQRAPAAGRLPARPDSVPVGGVPVDESRNFAGGGLASLPRRPGCEACGAAFLPMLTQVYCHRCGAEGGAAPPAGRVDWFAGLAGMRIGRPAGWSLPDLVRRAAGVAGRFARFTQFTKLRIGRPADIAARLPFPRPGSISSGTPAPPPAASDGDGRRVEDDGRDARPRRPEIYRPNPDAPNPDRQNADEPNLDPQNPDEPKRDEPGARLTDALASSPWARSGAQLLTRRPVAALAHPLLFLAAIGLSMALMASPLSPLYHMPKGYVGILALVLTVLAALTVWRLWSRVFGRSGVSGQPRVSGMVNVSAVDVACWCLMGTALLLRYFLNELVPLPENAVEEWKRASETFALWRDGKFTVDHRIVNLVSVTGMRYAEGSIEVFRAPVRLLGTLSVLAMGAALRMAGAGWPAVIFGVFVMASLRWLVFMGSLVDEQASDVFAQTMLILCMAGAVAGRSGNLMWAAWAGFFGGLLLYGHAAYRAGLAAAFLAPACSGIWSGVGEFRRRVVSVMAVFLLVMALVGAPALSSVFETKARGHVHYDWLYRHGREHGLNLQLLREQGPGPYLRSEARDVYLYAAVLFGLKERAGDKYLTHPDRRVVPLTVGLLFLMGTLHALFRPRAGGLNRALAALVLLALLLLGTVPGNADYSRMTALVAMMPFMAALMLDDLLGALSRRRPELLRAGAVGVLLLTAALCLVNVAAVVRQHNADDVLLTYTNRRENACRMIGEYPGQFDNYYVFDGDCNRTHSRWVFRDRVVTGVVENRLTLKGDVPEPRPGTMYLLAGDRDLAPARMEDFTELARELDAAGTMRTMQNSRGDLVAMAFCYRCGN